MFGSLAEKNCKAITSSSSLPATPFGWRGSRRTEYVHSRLQERRFPAPVILGERVFARSLCSAFLLQLLGGIRGPDRSPLEHSKLRRAASHPRVSLCAAA